MNGRMKNQGETKRCPKCGKGKPLEAFTRDRSRRDGLQCWCRWCEKAYREANKIAILDRGKRYYASNKKTVAVRQKKYYAANKETRSTYIKAYIAANKEILSVKQKVRAKAKREANIAFLESLRPLRCESCGYNKCFESLDFHHTDPGQKKHRRDVMGKWLHLSPDSFKAKIQSVSFIILCANCHRELHAEDYRKKVD